VEDWVGVFAILEASLGKDDGDEMDAGIAEEWNRRGVCKKLG